MKHKYLKVLFVLILFLNISVTSGQNNHSIWTKSEKADISQKDVLNREAIPVIATYYTLNMELLQSHLKRVPERKSAIQSQTILDFPNADGSMTAFRIMEYSVMAPELQAKYPNLRSYVGYSLDGEDKVVYFSVSSMGLHAMTVSNQNTTEFINPYTKDGAYEAFSRNAVPKTTSYFECGVIDDGLNRPFGLNFNFDAVNNANDGMRRTFRLAIGTSVEYTNFHGGTVASAMAAIIVTMTRVNGIYDRELSMRMVLVKDNDLLVSTKNNSLFSNTGEISLNTEIVNGIVGASNYDIGHSFTTGSGGSAYLNSACTDEKASGTTGLPDPVGDPFAIDFVSHEIGHQFGATHTFNGSTGNCSGNNRSSTTAYEPGSGSTIMSYAGICSPQNIQNNSDEYFHQVSLQQIWDNITAGSATCGVLTPTGNAAPTANAGASYNIPISTPYKLTGASTDVDGTTTHTYTWEQFDLGPSGLPTTTTEFGPMVRSIRGTTNPVRYIPNRSDVMDDGGLSSKWEKLASIGRVFNFALTVRDNDERGGQTAVDDMTVTTIDDAGPFAVTSQNSEEIWEVGAIKTVTWDVANTDKAPINTPTVTIKLSIDGGNTFAYTLAEKVPNNGTYEITVPKGTVTNRARVMVEGVDNIFYNVNSSNFKIEMVDFLLNFSPTSLTVAQPNEAVYDFVYNTYQGYSQPTKFSVSNLPSGATASFNPTSATANGTPVTLTVTTDGVAPGSYNITATGVSGAITNSSSIELHVFNSNVAPITLLAPADGTAGLYKEVSFLWEHDVNVEFYLLEIATDRNFTALVDSQNLTTTSYTASLDLGTPYYWRVTGSNQFGTGKPSSGYNFSTGAIKCDYGVEATDTPIAISSKSARTYTSTIPVQHNLPIIDLNVKVDISHSRINDLKLVLISPDGTPVVLVDCIGDELEQNFTNTVFDQEASTSIAAGTSPYTGSFMPVGDLSIFYGIMSAGDWKLQVTDNEPSSGGSIQRFALELCLAEPLSVEESAFEYFSIFPNPNRGEFTVKLQSTTNAAIDIKVFDLRGRKILQRRVENTGRLKEKIHLEDANSGLYLVHISDGLKTVIKKIIVD